MFSLALKINEHLPPFKNVSSEANMLGTFASATLVGKGFSQRSGLHSAASGPHILVLLLAEVIAI